jgi:hypothetical protein
MKRSLAFAFAAASLASACSSSESGSAGPSGSTGGNSDASVASGGNGTSTGGRSAGSGGRSGATGGTSSGSGGAQVGGGGTGTGGSTGSGSSGGAAGKGTGGSTGSGGNGGSGGTNVGSGGNTTNDAGPGSCGKETCTASEVCVAYRTIGGGLIYPTDAGKCPPGSHVEPGGPFNSHCAADYRYQCVPLVGCAGADVRCSCATGTCPSQYFSCSDPSSGTIALDPSAQLICQQLAP